MRWLLALGAVIGLAIGCASSWHCDQDGDCDDCRSCVGDKGEACSPAWLACDTDPFCGSLVDCVDECWETQTPADAVHCERTCRGKTGGVAVALYDEYRDCMEDACTLSCEW